MRTKSAFTMVEIVVVMGLLLAVALIVLPSSMAQIGQASSDSKANDAASLIFSTQQQAYARDNNKDYGIKLNSGSYIYYVGISYGSAEQSNTYALPSGVTISNISLNGGGSEIRFASGSFKTSQYGSFNVSDGSSIYAVKVNKEGLISVEQQ